MIAKRNVGIVSSLVDLSDDDLASVRLTVPVRPDQEEVLTRIVRTISQNRDRHHRRRRITKAAVIRAYIDALSSIPVDFENISDEGELLRRILRAFSSPSLKRT
jgi:DNA/RNA-binding domain of Phe-tRNA-synthetase-like protein